MYTRILHIVIVPEIVVKATNIRLPIVEMEVTSNV